MNTVINKALNYFYSVTFKKKNKKIEFNFLVYDLMKNFQTERKAFYL